MDVIRTFAGPEVSAAVVADEAKSAFYSFDATVSHHEVALTSPDKSLAELNSPAGLP
jgi:hypothetical protein